MKNQNTVFIIVAILAAIFILPKLGLFSIANINDLSQGYVSNEPDNYESLVQSYSNNNHCGTQETYFVCYENSIMDEIMFLKTPLQNFQSCSEVIDNLSINTIKTTYSAGWFFDPANDINYSFCKKNEITTFGESTQSIYGRAIMGISKTTKLYELIISSDALGFDCSSLNYNSAPTEIAETETGYYACNKNNNVLLIFENLSLAKSIYFDKFISLMPSSPTPTPSSIQSPTPSPTPSPTCVKSSGELFCNKCVFPSPALLNGCLDYLLFPIIIGGLIFLFIILKR